MNGTSWESTPTEPVTVILNNTITLSSAVGTDIQNICGNTAIRNITYTTTGVTGATFSGLPGGITGVWDSNVITISGIPSVSGTFNYTVTLTGGCGTVIKTGSIVVNEFPFIPTALISASQNNVCAGTPVTFTAIPVGDEKTPIYKWFINNIAVFTGASGTYIPKNGDEVYAMMTSSNPCATGSIVKSNAIKMVVNQGVADSVFISISQNNVCQGTPVTFKAIPVGGGTTPSYRWFQNKAFVSTGASGTYIPKNGDIIYVEMTSSLACTARNPVISNPITIVVNDKNTASVSIAVEHNNVCAGTPVTLTATSVEGGTTPAYTWFLNNVARATGTTANYVPKNGDVIHAEMTSSQACVTGNPAKSNIITMVVNQPESESVSINVSRNNIPEGAPVTFTAIPVGGGNSPSFLWYLNNVARVSGVTCSYAPKNGDEIYVVMKSDSPCSSEIPVKSDVVKMNVDCIPAQPAFFTQGKASVYQGQLDVRYTVPSVTGVTYIWDYEGNGATIAPGTSNSVLISFSDTATSGTLSVRASKSCGISEARSGVITVGSGFKAGFVSDDFGNGMKDIQEFRNELKVYPNPSSDGPVTFEFRINEEAKAILEIYSTSGIRISRIFEGDAEAGITRTVIYNEPRAPGVYIYTLKWKDQVITGKLIRKK